jgi:hypothetical protein
MRAMLFLVTLFLASETRAISNQELLGNMSSRMKALPNGSGALIKSFENHSQSYIYDQALAIIAFTRDNEKSKAKLLLYGLKSLQKSDGSLYFSYNLDGTSPYPAEGDKRIAGAMAWVALAAIHYQHKFQTKEFLSFNHRLLSYLVGQIRPISIQGKSLRALAFAPNDVASTPFAENDVAALEHNLDAYAALLHFSNVNKYSKWDPEVASLKQFILAMWDKKKSHFWSGASFSSGRINTSELYLDNQTWSLLALDQKTLGELSPSSALDLNCETFLVRHKGVEGFMDSKPTRRPAEVKFVWSEGTLGQILAMRKLKKIKKQTIYCGEKTSIDLLTSVKKMQRKDGGIGYATISKKDFTTASSIAGTAWMYFAANDFNPFHIEGLN